MGALELCTADEALYDYCLEPYDPPVPVAGRPRSVNLLHHSFRLMGLEAEGRRLVSGLHARLGPAQTVWGVKNERGGELCWELFFYYRGQDDGDRWRDRVVTALAALGRIPEPPRLKRHWALLSWELDADGLRAGRFGEMDVYLGGRAYAVSAGELELKNLYHFMDPVEQAEEILERLQTGVHSPRDRRELAAVLPSELAPRRHVCVACKRRANGVYLSGLDCRQALAFLTAHHWPHSVTRWLRRHRPRLGHLLWDVGVDLRIVDGRLEQPRSALYGSF